MKLFKKKDKNIEAEETLAKNAESAKTAADGKNAGAAQEAKEDVPETIVCPKCGKTVLKSVVKQHKYVCYECNYYFRVRAKNRIRMVSDKEAFEPWFTELTTGNPLNFPEYEEKIAKTQEKTGLSEGIVIGKTKIYGEETVLGVIDSRFMMGSMGHVVGEKITSAFERATEERLPVILFCCSGGARMQEGLVSLMQMAKTSMAIRKHSDAGLLYVPVLTDPTTGGVTASFAMLGDIILAEPKALIGFAGPRVIEQTIGQKLPKGFQRAEFLLEHGFVDKIVKREEQRIVLADILRLHQDKVLNNVQSNNKDIKNGFKSDNQESMKTVEEDNRIWPDFVPSGDFTPWEHVQLARAKTRPTGKDYIEALFDDFMEFHGDRHCGDDPAVIGGVAFFHGQPVTVLVQEKGEGTKENITRNFGMVSPEGYWKSLRLMQQAEKFHRPIILFVDTPGAFCGLEAEEGGVGEAIARNLFEMSNIKVPILSIMIGEGGSGGALAMAVGNEVWSLENSTYSILSPEGFAAILWKDGNRASEAAKVMKITAEDLKELGVIEQVIEEPEPVSIDNILEISEQMKEMILGFIEKYDKMTPEELVEQRYQRFRKF